MHSINVPLSGSLLSAALIMLFMLAYSIHRRSSSGAKAFALLCVALLIYSFGYGMEIYSTTLNQMLFWNMIQYMGLPLIPAFWLVISIQYTGNNRILSLPVIISIMLLPALSMIMRFTNSYHYLYYSGLELNNSGLFPVLHLEKGPFYYVNAIYVIFCVILSSFLYFKQFKKAKGLFKKQSLIMILSSIPPLIAFLMLLFEISPYEIDYAPFALTVSSFLVIIIIFKYRFLYLKPLVHNMVFENAQEGIFILDENNNVVDYNAKAKKIFPSVDGNIIGKNIKQVFKQYEDLLKYVIEDLNDYQFKIETDGEKFHYYMSANAIFDNRNQSVGYIITFTDNTKQIEDMEALNRMATVDDLTGIYNRRYFFERCLYELKRAKRYKHKASFIISDIDFFKIVNDEYGHQAGDAILKTIADVFRQSIRSIDILGRFGGEEFVLFLPETSIEDAMILASRIMKKLGETDTIFDGKEIRVTASFGVTGATSVNDKNIDIFLKNADRALYMAKNEGRNRVMAIPIEN